MSGGYHHRQPPLAGDRAEDWRDQAACTGTDPELFYPPAARDAGPARRICRHCPVRTACRDYALAMPTTDQYGVWGGMSARERQAVLSQRAGEAVAIHRTCNECQTPFTTTWANQRYCSPRCNHLTRQRRLAQRKSSRGVAHRHGSADSDREAT